MWLLATVLHTADLGSSTLLYEVRSMGTGITIIFVRNAEFQPISHLLQQEGTKFNNLLR